MIAMIFIFFLSKKRRSLLILLTTIDFDSCGNMTIKTTKYLITYELKPLAGLDLVSRKLHRTTCTTTTSLLAGLKMAKDIYM